MTEVKVRSLGKNSFAVFVFEKGSDKNDRPVPKNSLLDRWLVEICKLVWLHLIPYIGAPANFIHRDDDFVPKIFFQVSS